MIPFNHENIMMIATAVCVIGVIFLLRELNKTKEELYELKEFSEDVMERLNGIDAVSYTHLTLPTKRIV